MAGVTLKDISKRFAKNAWALRDINLTVKDGEFMVFLGPSGCGKTTLLRIISGLEEPTKGEVHIGGRPVNDVPPGQRGSSMVFQNYAIWPHMKVWDNIAFGLIMKRVAKDKIAHQVKKIAALVKIEELLDRYPSQLSGGQKQRVALARALVVKPQVFLMDEPFSNLDALLRMKMRTDLKYIHKQVQATTIFVTHDQAEAMSMADRITVMKEGQVAQIGTSEEVYFKPSNIFVASFIGSPTMNMLELEVQKIGGVLCLVSSYLKLTLAGELSNRVGESKFRKITLGVRPEDVNCLSKGEESFSAEVFVIEPQGAEQIVTLKLADEVMIKAVVRSEITLKPGQTISLSFDSKKLHLFDAKTGARIN